MAITGFMVPPPFKGLFFTETGMFFVYHEDFPMIKGHGTSLVAALEGLPERILDFTSNDDDEGCAPIFASLLYG